MALGDSTAQAIGASTRAGGYVPQLLARLPGWRVVNLSVSGARVADVIDRQVPELARLAPELVTCAVGANDLLRTPEPAAAQGFRRLARALPPGSVLANLPRGVRERRAVVLNAVIEAEAAAAGLRVADLWSHTGPPWTGRFSGDHFHPNEIGYAAWTDAFAAALGLPG